MEYDIQKLLVIKEKPKNTNVSFGFVGYESHFRFLIVMIEKLQLKAQLRNSSCLMGEDARELI